MPFLLQNVLMSSLFRTYKHTLSLRFAYTKCNRHEEFCSPESVGIVVNSHATYIEVVK